LAAGEIFALVVYAQLILENRDGYAIGDDLLDQIFEFMVQDLSGHALTLMSQSTSNDVQITACREMMRKPDHDAARYERVWNDEVKVLDGAYVMNA